MNLEKDIKIYFVRPKPEFLQDGMTEWIIATYNESKIKDIIYNDFDEDGFDYTEEYYIAETFLPAKPTEEGVIWGPNVFNRIYQENRDKKLKILGLI